MRAFGFVLIALIATPALAGETVEQYWARRQFEALRINPNLPDKPYIPEPAPEPRRWSTEPPAAQPAPPPAPFSCMHFHNFSTCN